MTRLGKRGEFGVSEPCDLIGRPALHPQDVTEGVAPMCDPGDSARASTAPSTCNNGQMSTIHKAYYYCYKNLQLVEKK